MLKNRLKNLTLLLLMTQTTFATEQALVSLYIPVQNPQSDIMEKDGIELLKVLVSTYDKGAYISAVTREHNVNSENEALANQDVNLGHIKGLSVYGDDKFFDEEKGCVVTIERDNLSSDYKPEELEKILSYVKKATKLNLKEHKLSCSIEEKTVPKESPSAVLKTEDSNASEVEEEPEDINVSEVKEEEVEESNISVAEPLASKALLPLVETPTPLHLETTALADFSKFKSSIDKVPFLFDTFYPLGYSSDGKIAYVIEYDTEPAELVHIETIIQDLVTDEILWSDEYKIEENITDIDFNSFWEDRGEEVLGELKHYKIDFNNQLALKTDKLHYKEDTLSLSGKSKKTHQENYNLDFLDSSTILMHSDAKGEKVINEKAYKDEHVLARKAIGFIPLGDDSSRVAVVVATTYRGWEGPPHNIGYEIVGASLAVGFKK